MCMAPVLSGCLVGGEPPFGKNLRCRAEGWAGLKNRRESVRRGETCDDQPERSKSKMPDRREADAWRIRGIWLDSLLATQLAWTGSALLHLACLLLLCFAGL